MPMASPIMVIMFVMKKDRSMTWPTTAVMPMAEQDGGQRHDQGNGRGDDGSEDQHQDDQRYPYAEDLAGAQVALGGGAEVAVDAGLAGDEHLEVRSAARPAVRAAAVRAPSASVGEPLRRRLAPW